MDKPRKGRRKEDITCVYLNDKERKMKEERKKEGRKEGRLRHAAGAYL